MRPIISFSCDTQEKCEKIAKRTPYELPFQKSLIRLCTRLEENTNRHT